MRTWVLGPCTLELFGESLAHVAYGGDLCRLDSQPVLGPGSVPGISRLLSGESQLHTQPGSSMLQNLGASKLWELCSSCTCSHLGLDLAWTGASSPSTQLLANTHVPWACVPFSPGFS